MLMIITVTATIIKKKGSTVVITITVITASINCRNNSLILQLPATGNKADRYHDYIELIGVSQSKQRPVMWLGGGGM